MISKECFIAQMKAIEKYEEILNNLPDWLDVEEMKIDKIILDIFDSLITELGDNTEDPLIYYWYYDLNKGTLYETRKYGMCEYGLTIIPEEQQIEGGCLTVIDGKVYKPTNYEELYDCLVEIGEKNLENL